jgi:hypothetical protein
MVTKMGDMKMYGDGVQRGWKYTDGWGECHDNNGSSEQFINPRNRVDMS